MTLKIRPQLSRRKGMFLAISLVVEKQMVGHSGGLPVGWRGEVLWGGGERDLVRGKD